MKVLHLTFKIKETDIIESINEMKKTRDKINSLNLSNENPSLTLAKNIKNITYQLVTHLSQPHIVN